MIISLSCLTCFLSVALATNAVCNIPSANGQPYCENGLRAPCSVSKKVNTDALVDAIIGLSVGAFATSLAPGVGQIKSFLNPMMGSSLKAMRAFTSEGPSTCETEIINWVAANFVTINDFNQFKQDVNSNFLINNIATDFRDMDNERYKAEMQSAVLMDDMTDASALGTYVQHLVKVADEARFAIADAVESLVITNMDVSAIQAALVYIIEGAKVGFQALTAAYAIIPYCWYHDYNEDCDPSYFFNELKDFKLKIENAKATITSTIYEKLREERENINRLIFKSYTAKRSSSCLSCRDWKETEWCGDNDAGCGTTMEDSAEEEWGGDNRRRKLQSTYTVAQCDFVTQFSAGNCYYEDRAFKTGAYAYQNTRTEVETETKGTSTHHDKCMVTNFATNKHDPKCSDSQINTNSCSGSLTTRSGSTSCTSAVRADVRDRLANEYEAELVSLTSEIFTVEERRSAPVEITVRGATGLEQLTITDSEGTEHISHQRVSDEDTILRFNVPTSGIFYMQWDLTTNPASQAYLVDSSHEFIQEQTTFTNENIITFEMPPTTEYLVAPSGEMSEIIGKMMQDMFFDLSSLPTETEADVSLSGLLATPESWFAIDDDTYVATDMNGEVALPIHQACSPPESPDLQTGKDCPPGNCLNGNTPYDTLYESWQACGVIYECEYVTLSTNGKYYLRRLSDPSGLGKLYHYECTSSSYNDAHYHVEIQGWEPATFNLRRASGTEEVTITSGSYVLSTTLTAEEQSFTVPLTKSGTFTIDVSDGTGENVVLTSDIDFDISLPSMWKDWGCGLTKIQEDSRCDRVRTDYVLNWQGTYVVSMPRLDATQAQENGIPLCAESGIDIVGSNILTIKGVQSAVACQKLCLIRHLCEFFTFIPASGYCSLKTSHAGATEVSDRISGPAVCYEGLTHKRCRGAYETYACASQAEAEAVCNEDGLTLCTEGQVTAFGSGPCAFMWTASSPTKGMYIGTGSQGCGTEGVLHKTQTSFKGTGKFNAACCQPADRYIRVEGTCPDICDTITSVEACSAAGRAMGLGPVRVQHQGGRLPGCFFFEPTALVEFNADLTSNHDWGNTDSLCDCRPFSTSAPFTAEMYGEQLEDGSKGVVTGEGSMKNMLRIRATKSHATLAGVSIKKSV